jgi:hypothetical protein
LRDELEANIDEREAVVHRDPDQDPQTDRA